MIQGESVDKALDRAIRQAKTGDKKILARKELLERVRRKYLWQLKELTGS